MPNYDDKGMNKCPLCRSQVKMTKLVEQASKDMRWDDLNEELASDETKEIVNTVISRKLECTNLRCGKVWMNGEIEELFVNKAARAHWNENEHIYEIKREGGGFSQLTDGRTMRGWNSIERARKHAEENGYIQIDNEYWKFHKMPVKECRICCDEIPIGRVVSYCDKCIALSESKYHCDGCDNEQAKVLNEGDLCSNCQSIKDINAPYCIKCRMVAVPIEGSLCDKCKSKLNN